MKKQCSVEGCERKHSAKGYCAAHYKRWRRTGDAGTLDFQAKSSTFGECSVETCDRAVECGGMCNAHYLRLRKGKDMHKPVRQRAGNGEGSRWISNHGYVVVTLPGEKGRKMEHRIVMERKLGRPLRRDENVHHINGIKDDNRPENLELWVRFQPSGQRVADLIEWANEIIRRYGWIAK